MVDAFRRDDRTQEAGESSLSEMKVAPQLGRHLMRRVTLALVLCWPFAASAEYALRPGDTIAVSPEALSPSLTNPLWTWTVA